MVINLEQLLCTSEAVAVATYIHKMLNVQIFFFLIPAILIQSSSPAEDCCQKKTVSDIASELNGVYTLKRDGGVAEGDNCVDGCVYTK